MSARSSSLECRSLGVGIGMGPRLAVVDKALQAGRFTAILGPNGAGKSTLMSMLVGERMPQSGDVWLDGQPLAAHDGQQLARRRAFMAQDCSVAFDFTAREVVELGRYPHRQHPSPQEEVIAPQAMALAGVAHLGGRSIRQLSGGERARVHLARALAQVWERPGDEDTCWLLLDEPTAALDLAHQHRCMGLLRQLAERQGLGVVAVIHDLNLALRYAHEVLLLGAQSLCGPVAQVLTPQAIERVWGVTCTPVTAEDGVQQYLFANKNE
ncbi:heme ABC transporter ATP-binding protein [Comamonas composti]|uniref:heme ABC transporter ATP-binding protein n=1 Tax=Comamonas composti TaxID=408558 RepID=UPI0004179378|nr:heme ABC transporter ATP-binding protein [Comamonas composti]